MADDATLSQLDCGKTGNDLNTSANDDGLKIRLVSPFICLGL
jgi:hypothetical protein